jgi:hypothetical protein
MMRKRLLFVTLAGGVAAVSAAAIILSGGSAKGAVNISNRGTPLVRVSARMQRMLNHVGATTPLRLMATRSGRSFYRFETKTQDCFSVAKTGTKTFGFICGPFPSAERPLLDVSVFGADEKGEPIHLISASGFAADGVAMIDAVGPDGGLVVRIPVVQNVYALAAVPHGRFATRLIARDASGKQLAVAPDVR